MQLADNLIIRNDDGVMYLTTQTVTTQQGETITTTQQIVQSTPVPAQPLQNTQLVLPQGFATTPGGLINGVMSFVLVIATLLVFFYLILGAFEWITSGGDKGKTEAARNKITASIIGLIIVAASYAILTLVLQFLGFSGLNDVFRSTGNIYGVPERAETELGEVIQATPSATPTTN